MLLIFNNFDTFDAVFVWYWTGGEMSR